MPQTLELDVATLRRAARAAGVSVATVRRWLCGRSMPRLDRAHAVADAIGVPLDELWPSPRARMAHEVEALLGGETEATPAHAAAGTAGTTPAPEGRPMVDGLNWSYSRLSDFLRCPAYGGFRHGLLPTPADAPPETPTPAAMMGSIVHRYAEATALLRRAAAGDPEAVTAALALPGAAPDRLPASARAVVDAALDLATVELRAAESATAASDSEDAEDEALDVDALIADTRRLVDAYDEHVLPLLLTARAVEERRETRVGDFRFTAVLDMVAADGGIHDLKTTGRTPAQSAADQSLQATVYWKTEHDLGADAPVTFDYLVRLKRAVKYVPLTTRRTMADVDRLAHVTHGIATLIDTRNLYPNPANPYGCRGCPFLAACVATYGSVGHPSQQESA